MDTSLIAVAGLAGLLAAVAKAVDFARLLANYRAQRSAILTQLLAWVAAVAVVFVYGAAEGLGSFLIPGTAVTLSDANGWAKVVVGFALGSTASLAVDWKQAVDRADSAAKPPLVSSPDGVGTPLQAAGRTTVAGRNADL